MKVLLMVSLYVVLQNYSIADSLLSELKGDFHEKKKPCQLFNQLNIIKKFEICLHANIHLNSYEEELIDINDYK